MNIKKYRKLILTLIIITIMSLISSIFIGRFKLGIKETLKYLFGNGDPNDIKTSVLFDIRIPRIVMALFVGTGLSLAGTTYQAVLMNPLASPDVLGTSSAAAFGASLGILLFPNSFLINCIFSFCFGILSIFLVFMITKFKRSDDILSMVLSGMIVGSVFMSLIAIIKYVADTEETLPAITFWLMGSFSSISREQLLYAIPLYIINFGIIYLLRWKLNIMSLGDEEAIVANIDPKKLRAILLTTASIIVSLSVTVAGVVGWVGLVIPHLARTLVGYNHGRLVPCAGILGGVFLLIIDNIARSVGYAEIPIGMLTAFIGAPIFMVLFIRGGKENES
ncbi:MAG: iron ABC transporter permease [Tissierellia bacterium]|nr:iron ABC transporter permease [Tissierellia bacterium]